MNVLAFNPVFPISISVLCIRVSNVVIHMQLDNTAYNDNKLMFYM